MSEPNVDMTDRHAPAEPPAEAPRYHAAMRTISFRKYQPVALRAWHWLNALALLGLLGTVLLRKTVLSWRTNSAFIQDQLQQAGTPITPELAKAIAVGIRTPMWDWHYVFGFTLAGLLVARLLIAIFLPQERPVTRAARMVRGIADAPAEQKLGAVHIAVVKVGYVLFYLAALFMVSTGSLMYFKDALGLSADLVHSIKDVHEPAMWLFVVFAASHIVGVVITEHRGTRGIVSDMIQGGDRD